MSYYYDGMACSDFRRPWYSPTRWAEALINTFGK